MDYQTNLEIAQDDQRFPAYRVELRSPFDRKYVKSYDNLAQGANTAFAPQGGHNGLWTANQANRVGRQSMERYHGGAGVGAVGNNPNCNPVNPPNIPGCQLPQGYVSYLPDGIPAGCQFMQDQGSTLCDLAVKAPDMFNSEFTNMDAKVSPQYQCPATQYITQNNCSGGGGGGSPTNYCDPAKLAQFCLDGPPPPEQGGCNFPAGPCPCAGDLNPQCPDGKCKTCIQNFMTANSCKLREGSAECENNLADLYTGYTGYPKSSGCCKSLNS